MKWFSLMILILTSFLACGPDKKAQKTDATEANYDYQAALQSYRIGINHLNRKEVTQGIEKLEKSVAMDPNNYRYHQGLGIGYAMNGQLADAEKELKAAIAINAKDTESLNWLGSIYTDQGRYDAAREALRQVITDSAYPTPHFAFFNLGKCLEAQDRVEEAVAAYSRAVSLNSEFYRGYISLAQIYKKQGDYKKALLYFRKAEPGFSNEVEILFEIGHALFKLNQYDAAKTYLAQVSILFPPPAIDNPTQDMLRIIEQKRRNSLR